MKKQNTPILIRPDLDFRGDNMEIRYKSHVTGGDIYHWHDYYEMEIITEGIGTYYVNGIQYPLTRGTAYLVTPVDFHQIQGEFKIYNIAFNDSMVSNEILELIVSGKCASVVNFDEESFSNIETMLQCLVKEFETKKPLRQYALRTLLEYVLIGLLRRTEQTNDEQGRSDITVMRVVSYVKFNFKKKLTLAEVARAVHLTSNYVGEVFSKRMGVSFNQYLMQTRLNYAKNLLLRGDISVQEAAIDSGFGSQTYFSDCFKKQFGYTPTDIKTKNLSSEE